MLSRRALLLAFAVTLAAARPGAQRAVVPGPGLVVDAVDAGSPADIAGLRPGVHILGWRETDTAASGGGSRASAGAESVADDPWTFELFAIETAPRVPTILRVVHDGSPFDAPWPARASRTGLTLAAPDPGAGTAPARTAAWQRTRAADELAARRSFDEAASAYRQVLALADVTADPAVASLVHGRIAALEMQRSRPVDALAELDAAIETSGTRRLLRAHWLARRASALRARAALDEASAVAGEALAIRTAETAGSWDEAEVLTELGTIELARRNLDAAETRYAAARAIFEGTPAGRFNVARADYNLALVDVRRGRLAEADARLQSAITVTSVVAPLSIEHGRNLNLAGTIRSQRGLLPDAARLFAEALAVHQRLDPNGVEEASVTNNLGIVSMLRGRFAEAEAHYRRSLALKEQLGVPPLDRGSTIGNLGLMSIERRDFVSARAYLRQSLDLVRQAAPNGPETAGALNNLARVERLSGNLTEAERYAREGLTLRTRIAPDTVLHAFSLAELGRVMETADRLDEAEETHRQALAIRQKLAPDGTNAADSLDALGRLAGRRGDLTRAASLHDEAGRIWQRMAPDGIYAALNLVERGRIAAATARTDEAIGLYARATTLLDTQTGSIGTSFETQADFRSGLVAYYREYAELLIGRGRADEAFFVTERSRARAFLALMAERDLILGSSNAALDEKVRTVGRDYDRTQAELGSLSPTRDGARVDALVARLRDLRFEMAALRDEAARTAPASGVRGDVPLDAAAARRALGPDTVALSYLAGERATHVFVLTSTGLSHYSAPLGRAALDERVARLARLAGRGDTNEAELQALAHELYTALVAPAEPQMARARHVLIAPDGSLHRVPFAALVRQNPGASQPRAQYFVEWRPVFQAPSLSSYARLRGAGASKAAPAAMLAAGDPHYTEELGTGAPLPDLPGTRREAETVAAVYGRQAELLLRDDATEARIRDRIGRADIVHLAVHGLANETFPLDSALALASAPQASAGDNGLLQGWEVVEQLQLRASLVVLSACDTAGTGEGSGEGLLGLTRAFQVAGAPSVVASLWRVPDDTTPTLMHAFHRQVRGGAGFAEALASAQRTLIADTATAHPYYWAAFVLNGDPR